MRLSTTVAAAAAVMLLAMPPARPAPGQAPGSVHGWWEGTRAFVPIHDTARPPNPRVKAILERISAETGDRWGVHWDRLSGFPRWLAGRSAERFPGDPVEAARRVISLYRPVFTGVEPPDDDSHIEFILDTTRGAPERTRIVYFASYYRGIAMYCGGPAVQFDKESRVTRIINGLDYVADFALPSPLPPEAATAPLLSALSPDSGEVRGEPRLFAYPTVPPRLAYECEVVVWVRYANRYLDRPLRNIFLVDAATGEVLSVSNTWMSEGRMFPLPEDTSLIFGPFEESPGGHPWGPDHGGRLPVIHVEPRHEDTASAPTPPPP